MNSFASIRLLLLTITCISTISAMQESQVACSCDLGTLLYHVTKGVGRNDWLYLAHENAVWWAEEKLKSQEHLADLDKYYLRFAYTIRGKQRDTYRTPLHEAVKEANVAMVKFLCKSGADKHKKIKGDANINKTADCAVEKYPVDGRIIWPTANEVDDADRLYHSFADHTIGLSAVELAQKLSQKKNEAPAVLSLWEEIYKFLSKDE